MTAVRLLQPRAAGTHDGNHKLTYWRDSQYVQVRCAEYDTHFKRR